jgi:hypothetical protein
MLWPPSSGGCIGDCTSVSSAEGDIIRVGALLDCSLLYCIEGCRCTSVSSSEVIICDIKNKKAYYNLFLKTRK